MKIDEQLKNRITELQILKGYANGFQYDCKKYLRSGNEILDCIVLFQSHYFFTSDKKNLIPMVYRDIALLLDKDISTIARGIEERSFRMDRKTILYKELFGAGTIRDRSGREVAQVEFIEAILEIIENENTKKPYTDEMIASFLNDKGYHIARRTVAKYRKSVLGILNSNQR